MEHVKFVSYTGRWPNLCSGILTLEIDDERYVFGGVEYNNPTNNPKFWYTTGECGFLGSLDNPYIHEGPWEIDEFELPDSIRRYADEICNVFNQNVERGCCGGCL